MEGLKTVECSESVHGSKIGDLRKRRRDMEFDGAVVQDLAGNWFAPKLRAIVKRKVDRLKSLTIFELKENHIPAKEE